MAILSYAIHLANVAIYGFVIGYAGIMVLEYLINLKGEGCDDDAN